MKRLLLRLAVSLLTFVIGFAAAKLTGTLWHSRLRHAENVDFESKTKHDPSKAKPSPPEDDITVLGRYANFDYAYSVLVPEGMMGAMNPAPNPNHGFGIDLMHPTSTSWTTERGLPKAYLWVDASYNSMEYSSPNEAIKDCLKWLRERHSGVRLMSDAATHLGPLRAVRYVIAYEDSGETTIEEQVVAFRNQLGDGSDIIYTIDLTTSLSRYDRDKQPVAEMQRSWLIDPLPNNYPLPPAYEESK